MAVYITLAWRATSQHKCLPLPGRTSTVGCPVLMTCNSRLSMDPTALTHTQTVLTHRYDLKTFSSVTILSFVPFQEPLWAYQKSPSEGQFNDNHYPAAALEVRILKIINLNRSDKCCPGLRQQPAPSVPLHRRDANRPPKQLLCLQRGRRSTKGEGWLHTSYVRPV